jgi:hypothetical protein
MQGGRCKYPINRLMLPYFHFHRRVVSTRERGWQHQRVNAHGGATRIQSFKRVQLIILKNNK